MGRISKRAARVALALCLSALWMQSAAQVQQDDRFERAKLDFPQTVVLAEAPPVLDPPVTFLAEAPEIDGRLDPGLAGLPMRGFTRVWKSDPANPDVPCHYRLAYGTDFLYVYLEAEADELSFRDRAYQNGDGFALVLALPNAEGEPTEEFYVLACSAVNNPDLEWTRRIFWYYNVNDIFVRTGPDTRLEFQASNGRIGFELLLPWSDVPPHHPWISGDIGFNLRFAKAVGEYGRTEYKVHPGTIGAENMPRWYTRLTFEPPVVEGMPQTYVALGRGNASAGAACPATAVTVAGRPCMVEAILTAVGADRGDSLDARCRYDCAQGLTRHDCEVFPGGLISDTYTVLWRAEPGEGSGAAYLTVLPEFDAQQYVERLSAVHSVLSPGSRTTFEFSIQRAAALLADLPSYEAASYERKVVLRLDENLRAAEGGEDPYRLQSGYLRRAFRSRLDGTLQPYVVRVPEDYDPGRSYPLVVYLHGSASTEADITGHSFISRGNVIEVGPFGRGPSNGFASHEAQVDIAEAIEDVLANYPIDRRRIVLTGFSMGGYGVYRTFYETPQTFCAAAVFSGVAVYRVDGAIDFNQEQHLAAFRDVPIFICHGELDRNLPFDRAQAMAERLRTAGARVEFCGEPDKGHEAPGPETIARYHAWLDGVLGAEK